jgi:hypothetical protein
MVDLYDFTFLFNFLYGIGPDGISIAILYRGPLCVEGQHVFGFGPEEQSIGNFLQRREFCTYRLKKI